MVNENNNLKPSVVNKKPYETVYEIKSGYEIPSYEEFMKSYENDEKVSDNYVNEFDAWDNINVPYRYGPGSSHSREKDKAKAAGIGVGGAIGVGVLTAICPPAGAFVAGTYATVAAGATATSYISTDDEIKEGAKLVAISFGIASSGAPAGGGANKLLKK